MPFDIDVLGIGPLGIESGPVVLPADQVGGRRRPVRHRGKTPRRTIFIQRENPVVYDGRESRTLRQETAALLPVLSLAPASISSTFTVLG